MLDKKVQKTFTDYITNSIWNEFYYGYSDEYTSSVSAFMIDMTKHIKNGTLDLNNLTKEDAIALGMELYKDPDDKVHNLYLFPAWLADAIPHSTHLEVYVVRGNKYNFKEYMTSDRFTICNIGLIIEA